MHTKATLYTGGKAQISRQNLFQINAGATAYDKPAASSWNATPSRSIDPTSLTVGGQSPDTNGNAYVVFPDNSQQDLTVIAPANHYDAWASATKYKSQFNVFVHQPWPYYPNYTFGPLGPPFGYPVVNGTDGGHAWWSLTTDAPHDAVYQSASHHGSAFVNLEVGYGPSTGLDWSRILYGECPNAPGEFPFYDDVDKDAQRTYAIGFSGLIGGLNHCGDLYDSPSTYDLCDHNCVHETRNTGSAAGITLPSDNDPEFFGFNLPPSNP